MAEMFDLTVFYQPKHCAECGEEISDRTVKGYCKRCWHRIYLRNKREERVQNGLCPRCGKPKEPDKFRECESCRAMWREKMREERIGERDV